HASQEDLKMLITLLSPEHYIPVQGDYRALYANATLAYNTSRSLATRPNGILLLDNGMKVTFDEKGAHFDEHDRIHVSNLAVDGFLIGESSSKTFLDRQVLSDNGIILVGFVFSKSERRIVSEIEVVTKGYIQTKSISFMKGRIEMLLKEVITSLVAENRFTIENMKELFKEKVSRFTKNETLTTPKLYTLIEEVA
ncbi:MAG: hypothetical protein LBR37_01825, partial [Erysipelotrichaceae bacterium]|nr:hypothetical protein [Erysipelotrichaceae bacterium]